MVKTAKPAPKKAQAPAKATNGGDQIPAAKSPSVAASATAALLNVQAPRPQPPRLR